MTLQTRIYEMPCPDEVLFEDDIFSELGNILKLYGSVIDSSTKFDFERAIRLLEEFDDETQRCYVATIDNELVAVANAEFNVREQRAWLDGLAVRTQQRKSGIGRALLQIIESDARSQELHRVSLRSVASATGFYDRLGYTRQTHEVQPVMSKEL